MQTGSHGPHGPGRQPSRSPDDERRRWLQGGAGLASGLAASRLGLALAATDPATDPAGPFGLGVASGTPSSDSVILWTRLVRPLGPDPRALAAGATAAGAFAEAFAEPFDGAEVEISWRLTLDETMRNRVASGRVRARPDEGHAVRVEVRGLQPDRWYWYRFDGAGGQSRIGRTRTLPGPRAVASRLRIAVASCQNYEHGCYAAWRHIVKARPDLIVHVGDYIYERSWGSPLVRPLRLPEARTLSDYRQRHAIYRRDPDLQAAHAAAPWFMVWDDHEVANDYAGWTPERPAEAEGFPARRSAAYQAWFEHAPVPRSMAPREGSTTIHQTSTVGDLLTLHLLDSRQYRSPQVCPKPGRGGGATIDPAHCADLADAGRTMLGPAQEAWLARAFAQSRSRWNLIAQQTLIAPLVIPGKDGRRLLRTDGWDGYPAARLRLLEAIEQTRLPGPVVIGGDLHAFHVADLHAGARDDGPVLAAEFVGTSIASQSASQAHYDRLTAANGHLHYANGTQRGYILAEVRRDRIDVDLMGLDDVSRADSPVSRQAGWVVERGRPGAQRDG